MITYLDTNVFVYSYINQGREKQQKAKEVITRLIKNDELIISPLVLQELIYVFEKLKAHKDLPKIIDTFLPFSFHNITNEIVYDAFQLCCRLDSLKNISDATHLKVAEKSCEKLITFDTGFEKFKKHTQLKIQILKVK